MKTNEDYAQERDALKKEVAALRKEKQRLEKDLPKLDDIWRYNDESKLVQNYMDSYGCIQPLPNEYEIVEGSMPIEDFDFCGVYFLLKRYEIVYVGQSLNVFNRIQQHRKDKDFDRFAWVNVDQSLLDAVERMYIHLFKPPLNISIPNPLVIRRKAPLCKIKVSTDYVVA